MFNWFIYWYRIDSSFHRENMVIVIGVRFVESPIDFEKKGKKKRRKKTVLLLVSIIYSVYWYVVNSLILTIFVDKRYANISAFKRRCSDIFQRYISIITNRKTREFWMFPYIPSSPPKINDFARSITSHTLSYSHAHSRPVTLLADTAHRRSNEAIDSRLVTLFSDGCLITKRNSIWFIHLFHLIAS